MKALKRKPARNKRRVQQTFRPRFETLEARRVLDAALFAGLEFVSDAIFSTDASNTTSVRGPVTLRVEGSTTPLLRFSDGVSFKKGDASGAFIPDGTVSLVQGQATSLLLNDIDHAPIIAADLLPGGAGVTIDEAATEDIDPLTVSGVSFYASTFQIAGTQSAYVVQMQGDVSLVDLGDFRFALPTEPQRIFVESSTTGIAFGADFQLTLQNKGFSNNGLEASLDNLEVKYTKAQKEFAIRGTGSIQLPSIENPIKVSLGDPNETTDYGIRIADGKLTQFSIQFDTSSSFSIGKLTISPQTLALTYAPETTTYTVSGAATFQLPQAESPILVQLGSPAQGDNPATQGIVIKDGKLTSFDMTIVNGTEESPNPIQIGSLTITPLSLRVTYSQTTNEANVTSSTYTVGGAATFQVPQAESPILVRLGSPAQGDKPATQGLVITDAKLTNFDMTIVNGTPEAPNPIKIGSLTITPLSLNVTYTQTTNEANQTSSTYTVTGAASFIVTPQMSAPSLVQLGTLPTEDDPGTKGLIITNGRLTNLDLKVVNKDEAGNPLKIEFNKLTITPEDLRFTYEISETNKKKFTFSGGIGVALVAGGETQFVSVALEEKDNVAGIVVEDGVLMNLRARVTADFNFKKLKIGIDQVTLAYNRTADSYEFSGAIKVSTTGTGNAMVDLSARFGDGENKPGLVIKNGSVTNVLIVVNGGFSLKSFTLQAQDLTVSYESAKDRLQLSGGVNVVLTDKLNVSAAVSNATPLIIDTKTGDLSVGEDGLMISGSLQLGTFSAMAMIKYSNTPSAGLSVDASVMVRLPQDIELMGTLVLKSGQLSSISLKYSNSTGIAIGSTGFFLTQMEGGLFNLDSPNLTNLEVKGSLSIRFGKQIRLAGTNYDLLNAQGSFTINKDRLNLTASVSLVGGKLGRGNGMVDINWSTGVFMVSAEIGLIDDLLVIRGDLYLDRIGNVTFTAKVAVSIPKSIPVVGGVKLGSGDLLLQIRPQNPSENLVAVTGSVGPCPFCLSGGFKYNFDSGSFSFIKKLPTPSSVVPVNFDYSYTFDSSFDSGAYLFAINVEDPEFNSASFDTSGPAIFAEVKNSNGTVVARANFKGANVNAHPPVIGYNPDQRILFLEKDKIPGYVNGASYTTTITVSSKTSLETDGSPPMFSQEQVYFAPEIQTPRVSMADNGLDVNIRIPLARSYVSREDAKITLFYQSSLAGAAEGGRTVIASGTLKDQTFISAVLFDQLTVNYTWKGLPDLVDLSQVPYDPSKQPSVQIYATIDDGQNPVVYSLLSQTILVPPNPVPRIVAEPFGEPRQPITAEEPDQQRLGIYLSEVFALEQDLPLPVRLDLSIDQGGYFGSVSAAIDGRTTFSAGGCTGPQCQSPITGGLANAQSLLERVAFVAGDDFTGISHVTLTMTSLTPEGQQYSITKVVPIAVKNAPLVVTQRVDNPNPRDGDIVTFTIEVENQNGPNGIDAENVVVLQNLPAGVTFVESLHSIGSFDSETGKWVLGNIPLNVQPARLEIKARINAGTEGTQLVATALATTDTRVVSVDDLSDSATFHVVNTPLTLAPLGPPDAVAGVPYPRTQLGLATVNGVLQGGVGGPYKYFVVPDAVSIIEVGVRYQLPPGLTLTEDGVLSGTPTTSGEFQVPVGVYDRLGTFSFKGYRIKISSQAALETNTVYLQIKDYDQVPFGAIPTFSVTGNLPPGLTLDSTTGILSGIPTAVGFYQYSVNATYFQPLLGMSLNSQETKTVNDALLVRPRSGVITPEEMPIAGLGQQFPETQLTALDLALQPLSGEPLTYLVTNNASLNSPGVLPPGLELTPSGLLRGKPTNFGLYHFTVIAVDNQRNVLAATDYSLSVENTQRVLLPGAAFQASYSEFLSAVGNGNETVVTYSLSEGQLPPGITLTNGLLSGTPEVAGIYEFSIQTRPLLSITTSTTDYRLIVGSAVTIEPTELPDTFVTASDDLSFNMQLTASGGSGGDYAFELSSGSLPLGLALTSDGFVIGDAKSAGTFRFTVKATDGIGTVGFRDYTLNVSSFAPAILDTSYTQGLLAHPFLLTNSTFSLLNGEIPGLTVTSDGRLTGTPTREGEYRFTAIETVRSSLDQSLVGIYTATYYVKVAPPQTPTLDYGDAPSATQTGFANDYPVTLAQDGARHVVGSLRLGTKLDAEANGIADAQAGQDGSGGDVIGIDDEDGVFITASMVASSTESTTSSIFVTASAAAKLDAWIDFNQNGDWNDAGEQVFASVNLSAGSNLLSFTIPAGAQTGKTGARFRLSTAGGLAPNGLAADGEVEDYLVTIEESSPVSSLAFSIPTNDTEVFVRGNDIELRKGGVVLFQSPAETFGELNFNGSVLDDVLLFNIETAINTGKVRFVGDLGKDTLRLIGALQTLDLTDSKIVLDSVEVIDLKGTGSNSLVLSIDSVKAASSTTDTLEVLATAGDKLSFGTGWRADLPRFIDGQFTHVISETAAGGTARVQVKNDRFFTNPLNRFDVDRNGSIQPLDALRIINALRRIGTGPLTLPTRDDQISTNYFDVSGENNLTALDALRVINALSRIRRGGTAEGESPSPLVDLDAFANLSTDPHEVIDLAISEFDAPAVAKSYGSVQPTKPNISTVDDWMEELGSEEAESPSGLESEEEGKLSSSI